MRRPEAAFEAVEAKNLLKANENISYELYLWGSTVFKYQIEKLNKKTMDLRQMSRFL